MRLILVLVMSLALAVSAGAGICPEDTIVCAGTNAQGQTIQTCCNKGDATDVQNEIVPPAEDIPNVILPSKVPAPDKDIVGDK